MKRPISPVKSEQSNLISAFLLPALKLYCVGALSCWWLATPVECLLCENVGSVKSTSSKVFQLTSSTMKPKFPKHSYSPQNSNLLPSHLWTCKFPSFWNHQPCSSSNQRQKKLKSDEFIEERLRAISIMLIYFIASPFRCHFAVEFGRALKRVANLNIDDPFKAFNRSRIDSEPNCDYIGVKLDIFIVSATSRFTYSHHTHIRLHHIRITKV